MASTSGSSSLFYNLPIARKFAIVLAIMAVPALVVSALFLQARNQQIDLAANEIKGIEYLATLRSLQENVVWHRGASHAALIGDGIDRARMETLREAMDRAVGAAEAMSVKHSALETSGKMAAIKASWRGLRSNDARLDSRANLDAHNSLMRQILELTRYVAVKSTLLMDPGLDSYYVMDAVVNQLPQVADRITRLGYEDHAQTRVQADFAGALVQTMQRSLAVAYTANASLEPKLGNAATAAVQQADALLRQLRDGNAELSPHAANSAGVAFFALYDRALPALREIFENRITRLTREKYVQLGFVLLVLLLSGACVYVVTSSVTGQIGEFNKAFEKIGDGNLDVRVPVLGTDELGRMAVSLNAMLDETLQLIQSRDERNRIQTSIQKLLDEMSGVAEGDLTHEAEVSVEVTGAIADSFNYMISELRGIVRNVNQTTAQVGESAHRVLATAGELAAGSQRQAGQVAEANNSIGKMARTIREVSSTAGEAQSVADQAYAKARQGTDAVQKTISGMGGIRNHVQETSKRLKGLGERSQEIGSIVQLIGDVADRTSILALNASIQAAMAGEAGRGFAVVAEEVERLAERATEATKKVGALIRSVQADTAEAMGAMEETTREVVQGSNLANAAGRMLGEIESVSSQLAELIRSISKASSEQAASSEEIAQRMTHISHHTQSSAAGAKHAAESVQELAVLAEELRQSMQRFRLPVEAGD
ncbi:MAG: methyl-accepting chemotaxis protein [Candidatus Solibacter usitatus]|nr:methyl-accepting chemotaxis protein [Candidatus Solibacter usitatus]